MPSLRPSLAPSRELGRDAPPAIALSLLLIAAPELLGGVYPWGMLLLSGAALCALGLALWDARRDDLRFHPLVAAVLIALAWTVIQALPLPCGLVEHLAPNAASELQRAHRVLGVQPPAWCSLSQDPGGTREEVIKGIGIVSAFMCAWVLSRRGRARPIYRAVAASGVLLALVACTHFALGATRVFGIYEPIEIRGQPFLAPLLNLNTLGGFLAMCLPILISLAFSERATGRERVLLQVCTGLVACTIFMTRSRGAVGALVLGPVVFAVLVWSNRRSLVAGTGKRGLARREALAAALAIGSVLAVVVYGGYSDILREFRGGGFEKFQLIGTVLEFSAREPWLGVGRGAFASAFAPVHNTGNRFEYAENFVAQWAAEWGAPVTLLLIVAIVYALAQALRRGRSIERLGAIAGVLALAAQNLVDIGLELEGVAIVGAVLLAACTATALPARRGGPRVRLPLLAVGLGALGLVALARPLTSDHAPYLREQLAECFERRDRACFRSALSRSVDAHPSDPTSAVLAAYEASFHRDRAAGRWINRAMQLAPGWAAPHELAARGLWREGRFDQARIELGEAMKRDPYTTRELACTMAKTDLMGVVRAVPRIPQRRLLFESLVGCVGDASEAAAGLDAIIATEFPDDPERALRQAKRALAAGDARSAVAAAAALAQRAPNLAEDATILEAQALRALGRATEAIDVLRRGQKAVPESAKLVVEEAQMHAEFGNRDGARLALTRLHGLSAASAGDTARAFMLEAALERKLGNLPATLRAYDQAYGITGEYEALSGIASTAEELGDRQRAAWAYGMMCGLGTTGGEACAHRDRLLSRTNVEFPSKAAQPSQR